MSKQLYVHMDGSTISPEEYETLMSILDAHLRKLTCKYCNSICHRPAKYVTPPIGFMGGFCKGCGGTDTVDPPPHLKKLLSVNYKKLYRPVLL